MTEADYYLAFSLSPTIGPKRFLSLLSHFGSAESMWTGSESEFIKAGVTGITFKKFDTFRQAFNFSKNPVSEIMTRKDIVFIPQNDNTYPKELFELDNPPIGLFCRGDCTCLTVKNKIGIVGSRKITSYGEEITRMFAIHIASRGIPVVSGMALGVDAIAHTATLDTHGKTIAVLGNGVDQPYPRENNQLYKRIVGEGGLIISEYPPGMQAVKGSFPARNRIIAAISKAILITEAGRDSGSLITAEEGIKLGRRIYAIPGPITSEQSEGTGYLIQNGATLAMKPEDILQIFTENSDYPSFEKRVDIQTLGLDANSIQLLTVLQHEALTLDNLSKKLILPISDISKIVTMLELQGYVKNDGQGKIFAVI